MNIHPYLKACQSPLAFICIDLKKKRQKRKGEEEQWERGEKWGNFSKFELGSWKAWNGELLQSVSVPKFF